VTRVVTGVPVPLPAYVRNCTIAADVRDSSLAVAVAALGKDD
jgi:hypothetical protein